MPATALPDAAMFSAMVAPVLATTASHLKPLPRFLHDAAKAFSYSLTA